MLGFFSGGLLAPFLLFDKQNEIVSVERKSLLNFISIELIRQHMNQMTNY